MNGSDMYSVEDRDKRKRFGIGIGIGIGVKIRAMGLKTLGESRVEKLKANARSPKMKLWIIRATTMVLLWTCLVQLTALGDTWGPRVLRGWPSSVTQDSHSLDVKFLPSGPARVLPPKSEFLSSCFFFQF